jgi:glycosyltransferase involved in cell wall biosynthesis
MKILIRLPNWLGDVVMSTAFVNAVGQLYPDAQIDVIIKKELSNIASLIPGLTRIHPFSKQEFSGLGGVYRFGKKLKAEKYDLFFNLPQSLSSLVMAWATSEQKNGLAYRINRSGIRSVVTVHDLIFMRFPEYFGRVSRTIYKAKLKYACRVADKIVAVSKRTKDDLVELLGISPKKIEVVYQGCDAVFKTICTEAQKKAVLKKYHITEPYILSVGTIEERKNLLVLIKALSQVKQPVKLVVVGRQTGYAELIKEAIHRYQLTDRMIFLSDVNFADLPALYQSAAMFVYPSRYEGFGIPILEALNSGTPVIAATGSCLEEAGGEDSIYVAPDDASTLAKSIINLLTDDALRQKMISSGRAYAANFNDDKLAAQLMAVYTPLLNPPRKGGLTV